MMCNCVETVLCRPCIHVSCKQNSGKIFIVAEDSEREKKKYTIWMTPTEKETLVSICQFNSWNIDIISDSDSETETDIVKQRKRKHGSRKKSSTAVSESPRVSASISGTSTTSVPGTSNQGTGTVFQNQDILDDSQIANCGSTEESPEHVCELCRCNPWVTGNPQSWLGAGSRPRLGNNLIRKRLYTNYWTVLDRRGLWNNVVYLNRKHLAMRQCQVQLTNREMMPECVLEQVRTLYPNQKDVPYMGHYW